MDIKEINLKSDKWSEQKITIQLNYMELSKIANQISDMEIKDESDAMLRWQFAALHDLCHDGGFHTDFAPAHLWPMIMKELKDAEAKSKKKNKRRV